ncbi:tRNA (adenosine(37)-N6)-threonylcarbamoyltransferase complex dimerization subunit type 1 TsaB [Gracilibacillus marinus]|uniref:tRNA (Adenosine(37)-N6)-threonylcarbamoyltransferase complex dimerization subunit type 1 TsaB n=1 Tax=Gracilibacillus marinus TaxID=630535 RepID=A0ABV8W1K3_9BACI
MNVLAIDTSNQVMSVAMRKDNKFVVDYTTNMKRNHSVGLMPAIDYVMKESSTKPNELDKIVVAIGPGSYTGVRIGLSTAKTMAWTLNIPIVTISSLELLAYNGLGKARYICPFFDARRGLVYTGLYEYNNKQLDVKFQEENIALTEWLDRLKNLEGEILFISPDYSLHQTTIEQVLGDQAIAPILETDTIPKASILAEIGENRPSQSVHEVTPNYLRMVEAEANWLKEQKQKSGT